jgi:hypothetical protein
MDKIPYASGSYMDKIPYASGSCYLFDCGCNDFKSLYQIHLLESFFIVRTKKNLQYQCVKWKRQLPQNVLTDAQIKFSELNSFGKYLAELRLVKYLDEEQNREC